MRFYPESTSYSGALPYRLTGKELETMNGLNQYDFGARRRMTGIPIWTSMDPLCEEHPWESPYAVCGNNFVRYTDRDGKDFGDFLEGVAESFVSNFTLGAAPANASSPSNADDYNAGRNVGDLISIGLGFLETTGGGMAAGAGAAVTVLSDGSTAPVTVPITFGEAAVAVHGALMTGTAVNNFVKQNGRAQQASSHQGSNTSSSNRSASDNKLIKQAKAQQAKEQQAAQRASNKQAATNRGNNREGNSNQKIKGQHTKRTGGNKGDKDSNGNARRAQDQRIKGPDDTK